jgi:hypothetical protein
MGKVKFIESGDFLTPKHVQTGPELARDNPAAISMSTSNYIGV